MLALRLARGTHPLVLLRRLLVAVASAGVGFLLLCALTYGLAHPTDSSAGLRLLWCLIPLAAAVHFAVAVARTDPSTRPRRGLSAVGLGPVRLALLAAVSTAVTGTLGSVLALLVFLHLRGDLGLPHGGGAAELLAAGQGLPPAAVLTLLALTPMASTAAAAVALRRRGDAEPPSAGREQTWLPWGVALTAAGLAVETYASRGGPGGPHSPLAALPLPVRFEGSPAGVLAGWTVTALGLALVGPGITQLCGRLLQSARPGATRLLAGRILMAESHRIGRPLGVVCAVAAAATTATTLYGSGPSPFGPLTGLGATLVVSCAMGTLLTAALEARQSRADTTAALHRLGAPKAALREAVTLRAAVLLAVFAPLGWVVGALAALPLSG
ncbi:hypothetical protein ACIHCQ_12090 [Streptomyces sp. NPDC052236]|uniref:hypothetical protein n=1 Tax=Streptomyces sp. NPDC052236 TaxID=3365686 RepID=UPI0037D29571